MNGPLGLLISAAANASALPRGFDDLGLLMPPIAATHYEGRTPRHAHMARHIFLRAAPLSSVYHYDRAAAGFPPLSHIPRAAWSFISRL